MTTPKRGVALSMRGCAPLFHPDMLRLKGSSYKHTHEICSGTHCYTSHRLVVHSNGNSRMSLFTSWSFWVAAILTLYHSGYPPVYHIVCPNDYGMVYHSHRLSISSEAIANTSASTASKHRSSQPLQSAITVSHYSQPLQSAITVSHCSQPLQSAIAITPCKHLSNHHSKHLLQAPQQSL